jgi:hypothetical protein
VGVGRPDELPGRVERSARGDDVPRRARSIHRVGGGPRKWAVTGRGRAGAPALRPDDGGDARNQVAEVVRQVSVVAADQPLVGEVSVLAVRRVGEHVVAEAVDADGVDEIERLHHVPRGLAHLLAAAEQPATDRPAPRWLDPRRHQHRRPVHAVLPDDVLADEVVVDRPPVLEAVGVGAEPDRGEVVGERVEPHVRDVAGVPWQRDPPRQAGAADGEVTQSRADQSERLVAPELRHDRSRMGRVPVEQAVLEAGEAKEVVLLLELLDRQLVDRAQVAGQQVVVAVVQLATHAVLASVEVELDVTGGVATLEELLHRGPVAGLGRADEVVVGDLEVLPRLGELRRDRIGERLRIESGRVGGPLDVEAVLVGSGQEQHLVAEQPVPARQRVADDRRVGVTQVRFGVDVVDRRGGVEPARGHATEASESMLKLAPVGRSPAS